MKPHHTIRTCRLIVLLLAVIAGGTANGQFSTDSLLMLPDTVKPLTLEYVYQQVIAYHPVAKQAGLLSDVAKQEIRLAKGNFDPKIDVQYLSKDFGGTEYYKVVNGSLKFPIIFPVDPVIGVERNSGSYLNPERYISDQFNFQQFYTGLSLPLGRGLITDDRRAALKQAALFGDMMEAEKVKLINKLLLEAAKDYWQWSYAYYNYRLYNQSVYIASEIFRRVKLNNELGEAAPIDTIQAKITLQQRLVERQEAFLIFQNSGIQLSNYLWDSLANPLELSIEFAPILQQDMLAVSQKELESLLQQARINHPELQKLDIKLKQLEVDRRLATEYLKPRLDLSYYLLNQPFDPNWNSSLRFAEDYKFGVDFSFPVFIRKERAKLAQTKIKISSTSFERAYTERQIMNEVNSSYNALLNNGFVMAQQSDMVRNYGLLLQAELINLENGESDLFKINIQQEKLILSQSKLIKLLSDYEKQKAYLYWAAGTRKIYE
ncbi:MAG: TolC family protein [Cyclobacteriaceae bacterium]|nr:TolC family protein [Cyclobacteriaceae bacterium]MDH4295750.1 TolC family protein [Cyclobacteriaceae bacterium]MDH5249576.1 TolC family protein [Cyclobacteriaceae bacterium]